MSRRPMDVFLKRPSNGRFYLFFIRLVKFFISVLCGLVTMLEDLICVNMIDPKDNQDTSFIHRTTEAKPPRNISHYLIGRPLSTADAQHQTINKSVGLAVFASDALSSTAYATQEILVILAAVGAMAFGYVFPISIVIVVLLAIVVISYVQIIHAYPDGGGAYIVAYDNLGRFPALVAAGRIADRLHPHCIRFGFFRGGTDRLCISGIIPISGFYLCAVCYLYYGHKLARGEGSRRGVRHSKLFLYCHHVYYCWDRAVPLSQWLPGICS